MVARGIVCLLFVMGAVGCSTPASDAARSRIAPQGATNGGAANGAIVLAYDEERRGLQVIGSPGSTYRIVAIWRYVPAMAQRDYRGEPRYVPLGNWEGVVLAAPSSTVRFSTSQRVVSLSSLLVRQSLASGTYYVLGKANGVASGHVVNTSAVQCQDITLGPPPAEAVAACVDGEARFVPDPANLSAPAHGINRQPLDGSL